jgi:elongation factor P
MAKISTNDLRSGMAVRLEGEVFIVVEAQHYKPGKGQAFVRVKLKNLKTGQYFERNLKADEDIERPFFERRDASYMYNTGDSYYFLDQSNFEQIGLPKEMIGEACDLLKENEVCSLLYLDNEAIGVELPTFVEVAVVEAPPGVRGDTASNVTKPVKVETGATIMVPLFIKEGDRIQVDTRTHEYVRRL